MLATPAVSATIDGAITNRVKVLKPKRASTILRAQSGRFFDRDPSMHGKAYRSVCVSIPSDELDEIDRIARILRKSRSALIRAAIAKIDSVSVGTPIQVCVTIPMDDLARIDQAAQSLGRSRSGLICAAVSSLRAELVANRVAGIVNGVAP